MLKYTTMYVKILEAIHEVELVLVEAFFKLMCSNFTKYCIDAKWSQLFINDRAIDHVLSLL